MEAMAPLGAAKVSVVAACWWLLAGASVVQGARPCCVGGELVRRGGYCGEGVGGAPPPRIATNCSQGNMLLRDIVLDGDKLYTQDTPDFLFSEDPNEYCVGEMYRNASATELGVQRVAVLCYQPSAASTGLETSGILTLISVVFLLATVAVYGYLPQLRDLQGLCYVCVCVSMSLGFLALGALQLSPGFRGAACAFTGFTIYFWMMATFFWMNVVCVNMYRTVMDSARLQRTARRQFFFYSCYAWGGPLLLLLVSLIANFLEGNHYKPGIDGVQCWFQGRTETWLFFYGPVAVLVCGNMLLFVLSSLALWRQTKKYEINTLNVLKHRFLLCLKMFLVMGISWVFEIASFAHGESHIVWKIMDTFNCLQGVIIFVLLVVLRRRAVRGLVRAGCGGRPLSALADRLAPHEPDSADLPVLPDGDLPPDAPDHAMH